MHPGTRTVAKISPLLIFIGACALAVATSICYYFGVALPAESAARLAFEKQKYSDQQKAAAEKQQREEEEKQARTRDLQECQQVCEDSYWGYVKLNGTAVPGKEGSEVVEVYLGFPKLAGEPPRVLKGIGKVMLQPGEEKTVQVKLDAFRYWDDARKSWTTAPGLYQIMAGRYSRDIAWTGTLTP